MVLLNYIVVPLLSSCFRIREREKAKAGGDGKGGSGTIKDSRSAGKVAGEGDISQAWGWSDFVLAVDAKGSGR